MNSKYLVLIILKLNKKQLFKDLIFNIYFNYYLIQNFPLFL